MADADGGLEGTLACTCTLERTLGSGQFPLQQGVRTRLRRIMLAKSWNYAFMDSRIMLVKSSYYALAPADIIHLVMEPQSSENCAFFVLASCKWP